MVSHLVRILMAAALLLLATQRSEAQLPPNAPTQPFALPSVPTLQPAPPNAVPPMPMSTPALGLRFTFKIDPKTPVNALLPVPSKTLAKAPHWTNEDLAKVFEVTFGEPVPKSLEKFKAMNETAHILAKVNHLNAKKTDGFMLALLENRGDLRGLPFLMGDDCRTGAEQARIFAIMADQINTLTKTEGREAAQQVPMEMFLAQAANQSVGMFRMLPRVNQEKVDRATVAAANQIFMPESEAARIGLARYFATISHVDATKALARLALFSPEDTVRAAAIDGLKTRREKDYTAILLDGFRYPLPAVSKRAAEALVKLERKDLIPNLLDVLEKPDPRLPSTEKRDGKDVIVVREMVKVNHHRNCVLCHAPGNTEAIPEGVLTVAVPLPGEPLPKPSQGGYQSTPPPSPDITVRLDMTYLRQDFSVMMPVADAHPWPEMQRFDFLVRTRELTPTEAQEYEPCCEPEEPGRLSPYHRSALFALRELTGRDTAPTAAAWRKLLNVPGR